MVVRLLLVKLIYFEQIAQIHDMNIFLLIVHLCKSAFTLRIHVIGHAT